MITQFLFSMANYLWQSTAFAALAGLLAFALKNNNARTRHAIWLAASIKFLVPFSLLIWAGGLIESRAKAAMPAQSPQTFSVAIQQFSQPFEPGLSLASAQSANSFMPIFLFSVWIGGCLALLLIWTGRWWRLSRMAGRATHFYAGRPWEMLNAMGHGVRLACSNNLVEPGVFGIVRPILLLPACITDLLTDAQLNAILAHELCHVRSRDNLAAATHKLVESIFWFHPLVWWIGRRLLEERERACDEAAIELGTPPQAYAEGILAICKYCLKFPAAFVSGVTGSDLKKRIHLIMTPSQRCHLSSAKKTLLACAALASLALPIVIGIMDPPAADALQSETSTPSFEAVSVHVNKTGARGASAGPDPGGERFTATNAPLIMLIVLAYKVQPNHIVGMPKSLNRTGYDIEAKSEHPVNRDRMMIMLQSLLADRFKLALHRETKELPVYELVPGKGGPTLQQNHDGVQTSVRRGSQGEMIFTNVTMPAFAFDLSMQVDRPVIDKTGMKESYDFALTWTPDHLGPGILSGREQGPPLDGPSIFTAINQQLGLKLQSAKGPVEFLTIDHIEQPTEN